MGSRIRITFWVVLCGMVLVVRATPLLVIIDTGVCAGQVTEKEAPLAGAFASDGKNPLSHDFVRSLPGFADENGHGTHVSGIVWRELLAREPQQQPALVMLRAGRDRLQVEKLLDALAKIQELKRADHQIPVVLCPFSMTRLDSGIKGFDLFAEKLSELLEQGTIVVSATDGKSRDLDQLPDSDLFLPGCLDHPNLLTITPCSRDGFLAPRASFGTKRVFAAAHGTQVTSLWLGGKTKKLSGSSQAAALAAAEVFYCLTRKEDPAELKNLRGILSKRALLHPSLLGKTASQRYLKSLHPAE